MKKATPASARLRSTTRRYPATLLWLASHAAVLILLGFIYGVAWLMGARW